VLGGALSLTNLYIGLKSGWGFGVAITACILSYAIWTTLVRAGIARTKMTILENNCMQSTASAAGYSTGTTLIHLDQLLRERGVTFVGVDNSEEMLAKCKNKLAEHGFSSKVEFACADLNQGIYVEDASLALMVLTLQFIRPLYRDKLIRGIYEGLRENGALILVEKVLGEDSFFNRSFIKYYYEFKKRNDYSEMEISQKREALENVLIPYRLKENLEMLELAGFKCVDVFFKWYNFAGIVAVKR